MILKTENNSLLLKPKEIVRRIIFAAVFSLSIVGLSLINHFLFLNRTDRKVSHNDNITFLIVICTLAFLFILLYVLNIFIFKKEKMFMTMSSVSDGGTTFCLISSLVILLASQEKLIFNKDYTSLLISSSFTLLGFGLTITAILVTYIVKEINKSNAKKRIDIIFTYLLPYFLFFGAGLIYTISALLELPSIDIGYYKIIIYKSLFYSGVQMFFLVLKIIGIIINSTFDDFTK